MWNACKNNSFSGTVFIISVTERTVESPVARWLHAEWENQRELKLESLNYTLTVAASNGSEKLQHSQGIL